MLCHCWEYFCSEGYACVQSMQKKRETRKSPNFNMPAGLEVHHCVSSCVLCGCQKYTHCFVVLCAGEKTNIAICTAHLVAYICGFS